jgi:CelD/BcsL family acetyltransferase involved in cellulose biosynthesis
MDEVTTATAAVRERDPRPGPEAELSMTVVEDSAGLDALEREWNGLLERSDASVFQTFEWQRTWWRHFGEHRRDARLHLVTVRGREGLVAVAPLFVERRRVLGVLRLRRLLFVGHQDSDYLDVLAERGREAECAERIAGHLSRSPLAFDVAVLEETPDRSVVGPLLHAALLRRGWASSRRVESPCPRTALERTWDATLARFTLEDRREIRRRLRNIQKEHRAQLEVVPPGAQVEPAMREFIEMHQERWARDAYWGAFAEQSQADFHCEVAERLSRRGWLFLGFLQVDGRRLSVNYGYAFRDAIAIYLTGSRTVDEQLGRLSPGRVVHAMCMQRAVEEGRAVYDFMRGAERYKYELGAVDVPNWTIVAYPRSGRALVATHRIHRLLAAARRRVRREALAVRVASRHGGWLSPAVREHLGRALRRAIGDARRVLSRRSAP